MNKSIKAFFQAFILFLCFFSALIANTIAAPVVESVAISGDKLIVTGHKFLDIDGLILSDPKTGFKKPFKVESATESEIVGRAVDDQKITVASLMNLIIDTAKGETTYPVSFSLQKDAVTNPTVKNGAITPEKFIGVTETNPPDQTVLTWSQATNGFVFTKASAGGGSSGVSEIVLGSGIIGAPNTASGSVPISVDTGITGDASKTKIPYFNSTNKIVLDSTNSPTGALSGLSFKDGTLNFDISNDNALRIDSNTATDLFVLDVDGNLALKGPVTVGGFDVCLSNGNCIPSSGLTLVTATAPLVAAKTATGTTNISAGAVNTANNLVQLESTGRFPATIPGVVRGPGSAARSATTGNLAIFSDTSGENLGDGGIGLQNVVSMSATPTSANKMVISTGTNKVLGTTSYTIPTTAGVTGQVLGVTATGTTNWVNVSGVTSFNTRTGAVIPQAGDYSAAQVTNLPFGIITATTVQQAIDQLADLDSQKLPKAGGTMTGTITTSTQNALKIGPFATGTGEVQFLETAANGTNYVGFKAAASIASNTVWILPAADGSSGTVLSTNGSKQLAWSSLGAAGVGNVVGPSSSTSTNLATFNGTTGKLIQDSGISSNNLVTMSGTVSSTGNVIITGGGKIAQDSNIPLSNLPIMQSPAMASNTLILSAGNSKDLKSTPYTIPPIIGSATYALKSDGTNVQWAPDASGIGDVVGPASSTDMGIPTFSGTSGKILQTTLFNINGNKLNGPNFAIGDNTAYGDYVACLSHINFKDSYASPGFCQDSSGGAHMKGEGNLDFSLSGASKFFIDNTKTTNKQALVNQGNFTVGTNILFVNTQTRSVGIGTTSPTNALQIDSTVSGFLPPRMTTAQKNLVGFPPQGLIVYDTDLGSLNVRNASGWLSLAGGTGDVVGPATATLNSIARYESGKVIKESGIIIDDTNNISGINQLNGKVVNNLITGNGLVGNLPIFGLLPSELEDSGIALINIPTMASNATAAFHPILSAGNNKSQVAAPYTLPNSVCSSGQILKWNTTGFTCQNDLSGSGDVSGPANAATNSVALFADGTGKVLSRTDYTIPPNIGSATYILKSDGTNVEWAPDGAGTGDVVGPPTSADQSIAIFSGVDGKALESTLFNINGNALSGPSAFMGQNLFQGPDMGCFSHVNFKASFNDFGFCQSSSGKAFLGSGDSVYFYVNGFPKLVLESTKTTHNQNFVQVGDFTVDTNTFFVNAATNSVGIGTATPTQIFQIDSTTSGFLPPRMSTAQKNAINPQTPGLVIFDTDLNSLSVRNASGWMPLGSGTGNVVGPATSTLNNFAAFSDGAGKIIKDSGINSGNLPTMATAATVANQIIISAGPGKQLTNTLYPIPAAIGASGTVLKSDGTNATWQSDNSGSGDVMGPASSSANNLASFNNSTGKLIQDSGVPSTNLMTMTSPAAGAGNILTSQGANKIAIDSDIIIDGSSNVTGMGTLNGRTIANFVDGPASATSTNLAAFNGTTGKLIADSGVGVANVVTKDINFTAANRLALSAGNNKKLSETGYTIPQAACSNGEVLKFSGGNLGCAPDTAGTGDVAGPATATLNSVARYESGKVIKESGIIIDDANNISGINQLNGIVLSNLITGSGLVGNLPIFGLLPSELEDSGIALTNIPTMASNATAAFHPILSGGANKSQIAAPYTLPNTTCLAGEVLKWNATGFTCQADFGGTGNVAGPASSSSNTLAQFSDSTGKIIKGTAWTVPTNIGGLGQFLTVSGATNLNWTSLPTTLVHVGNAPVVPNNLSIFGGSDGTQILDSGLAVANVPTMVASAASSNNLILSGGADKTLKSTAYTIPPTIGSANFVLKSDGTNATWQADVVGTGDVAGPATATLNSIARYQSGKVIKESGIIIDDANNISGINQLNGIVLSNLITGSGLVGNLPIFGLLPSELEDSGIALINIPTMASNATAQFHPILSGGANKTQIAAPYTLPNTTCLAGEVLKWNATGFTCQADFGGSGDVAGPATSTLNNLVAFSDTTGKNIKDSGINSGNLPSMATAATAANKIIISAGANKQLTTTLYPIPAAIGASGTVLKSDGTNATWQADVAGTGDVAGPSTATLNSVARFQSGKVIKNSGIIIDDTNNISGLNQLNGKIANNLVTGSGLVGNLATFGILPSEIVDSGIPLAIIPTMASNATAQFHPILSGGANKSQVAAPYTLPNTTCLPGEVLKWNTTGFTCQSDLGGSGAGDVAGPGTATVNSVALFADGSGKVLKATDYTFPNLICPIGQVLKSDGANMTCQADVSGLTEWVAGKAYKAGEIVNTGSDANWLFKVVQDHTSVDVPGDFRAGKIMAIAPPIITTGVQDGGGISLAGNVATVQGGTGYIAKYGTSPSAWPLITIVEWTTQSITLPSTGLYTLFIDENGALTSVSGVSTKSAQDNTISAGLVDMNLGKAYDRETYPTNPVGQLRGLAFFFGGMTRGLSYVPSVTKELARTAYEVYFWGANRVDPYDPNTKSYNAMNPVQFYEFTQNGLVFPSTLKTQLRNVYDNNGTLTSLGGSKWGFARIFSTLGQEDYIMYSQVEYGDEIEAKDGAISSEFIKPPELSLTKFSSWIVFKGNDDDFSDNTVTTCEPFGCDKIGSAAGGGGGAGDVFGPPTSLDNTLAQFSGFSGKTLKATPYAFPITSCTSGQILKSDGVNFVCAADSGGSALGDVVGPASSGSDTLASFNGTTGKLIKDSGIASSKIVTMDTPSVLLGNILTTGGGNEIVDSGNSLTNIPIMASNATAAFHPILSGGNNKTQIAAPYSLPNTTCLPGEVLKWNVTGFTCQSDLGGTGSGLGDVLGPAGAPINSVALFSDSSGKVLKTTGYTIPNLICPIGQVLKSDGTNMTCQADVSGLTEWVAGKAYKAGEIVNTGSDANWLFKVVQDHTSADVPADFRAGKIMAIAPPIITTGVQDGGKTTLSGNVATVQGGTGYISKYGASPSAWPLITIVEWPTQTITLPTTGIHSLFINENGGLISTTGISGFSAQDNTISVGLVDMNLGTAFDRQTYPTNPVGQLRGLAFFFGAMTKGLNYGGTGLQLSRSAYEMYYWGADNTNPYDPNSKDEPAVSPVSFFEFTKVGPVIPVSKKITLRNNVYDNNGTLTTMGQNKWGFIRIYSSPGVDDYVMYSQAEYGTINEAKTAAISPTFVKPADLELTKFSAWLVFQKGDTSFSNNPITVCEPFGCDKIGTSAGGGTTAGDVLGPVSSLDNSLAQFSGTNGKTLKSTPYAFPLAVCTSGQVLKSDGLNFICAADGIGVSAASLFLPSDKKLKKEIKNLPEGYIERLMDLRPVSFVWRDTLNPDMGFIAQDVSKVFPDLVEKTDDGLGINYSKLVVPIVKAFQEKVQKDEQTIKMLLERIERLEKIIGKEAKR